ncbi:hypothetical protein SAMN05216299_12440 [Nitrosospira sp. Nsp14]|nr:hypothetical protein SAMN05216299_12440 [Nitrosospira sp. Nsp14]
MHPVIAKTFGGLSKPYYFRQFFFGLLLFLAFTIFPNPTYYPNKPIDPRPVDPGPSPGDPVVDNPDSSS